MTSGQRIVVLGSSSILGSFPELGESPGPLENTFDADLLIAGINAELAGTLAVSIGKGSPYHVKEGYFIDTLKPAITEAIPPRWEERLVPLPGFEVVLCLDPHDLAAVKIQAGRPKDLELCATLLATQRLQPEVIEARLRETPMEDRARVHASLRFKKICEMAQMQNL